VQTAHEGTLFIDEAADVAPAVQPKLLRLLETGELRRVGSSETTRVRFRLVAATQIAPADLVKSGRWREDFGQRLMGIVLRVPALHEHRSDIPLLAEAYSTDRGWERPSASALTALQRHSWPGNVRELQQVLARAAFHADGCSVTSAHVRAALEDGGFSELVPARRTLAAAIERHVREVVESCCGDVTRAAALLAISRRHVYRLLKPARSAPGAIGVTSCALRVTAPRAEPPQVVPNS